MRIFINQIVKRQQLLQAILSCHTLRAVMAQQERKYLLITWLPFSNWEHLLTHRDDYAKSATCSSSWSGRNGIARTSEDEECNNVVTISHHNFCTRKTWITEIFFYTCASLYNKFHHILRLVRPLFYCSPPICAVSFLARTPPS